jgi:hypothetical protein
MSRLIRVLALTMPQVLFAQGCASDCDSPTRLDGPYVVWSNAIVHDPATIPEGYPSTEVFYNGFSEWVLSFAPARSAFDVVIDDQAFLADFTSDDTSCDAFHLRFSGLYTSAVSEMTSDFSWEGTLSALGSHLGGAFTYRAAWQNPSVSGASGSVEVEGEMSGVYAPEGFVDTAGI